MIHVPRALLERFPATLCSAVSLDKVELRANCNARNALTKSGGMWILARFVLCPLAAPRRPC
jgi:hypothetical protein